MTVLLSVAELFPGGIVHAHGAAIVAVLEIVPEPLAVAVTVNVAVPPESSVTLALMLPLPLAGQLDPALALQVHVAPVSAAGKLSVTVAPVAVDGPAFDATMVYVTVPFWFTPVTPSVLVMRQVRRRRDDRVRVGRASCSRPGRSHPPAR
jgi:hypothetical protein